MNIVQQAAEKISQELAKQFVGIQNHPINFANLVQNIQTCVNEIGISMVEALISEADTALRLSTVRKREWYVQRNEDTKMYATLLGPVELTRTYYIHEGYSTNSLISKHRSLKNCYYFSGLYTDNHRYLNKENEE